MSPRPIKPIPDIGRPEYTQAMGKTHISAEVVKEWLPKPWEKLKPFRRTFSDIVSVYPWVRSPVAPGETITLVDQETGLLMPYTIPKGMDFWMLKYWFSSNESWRLELWIDGQFSFTMYPGDFYTYFEQEVTLFRISMVDPKLQYEHKVEIKAKNIGQTDAYGSGEVVFVLMKKRTGSLETKDVRCHVCGEIIKNLPYEQTEVRCTKGHLIKLLYFPWGGT